ncbi:Histidine biosynthesis bifunctional protein hisB, partial [Spiromyces aspiralis]
MPVATTRSSPSRQKLYLLDYGAGNVRSLLNAIESIGYHIEYITQESDFDRAEAAMDDKGFSEPLRRYIASGRPLMGICVGMQVLFEGSDESPDTPGLGIIPGTVKKFDSRTKPVPQIGWNSATRIRQYQPSGPSPFTETLEFLEDQKYYFVHSYAVPFTGDPATRDWVYTATRYQDEVFVSSVWKGNVFATQFHPEKSGKSGLALLRAFIESPLFDPAEPLPQPPVAGCLQPED